MGHRAHCCCRHTSPHFSVNRQDLHPHLPPPIGLAPPRCFEGQYERASMTSCRMCTQNNTREQHSIRNYHYDRVLSLLPLKCTYYYRGTSHRGLLSMRLIRRRCFGLVFAEVHTRPSRRVWGCVTRNGTAGGECCLCSTASCACRKSVRQHRCSGCVFSLCVSCRSAELYPRRLDDKKKFGSCTVYIGTILPCA